MRRRKKFILHRNIFKEGFLSSLANEVLSGKPVKEINRLRTFEFAQIPKIYACLNLTVKDIINDGLNNLLEDKFYKIPNGDLIHGKDIKAITTLMYIKSRTAYWEPDGSQIYDTSLCCAVPIPLLGFKRFRNISYNTWMKELESNLAESNRSLKSDDFSGKPYVDKFFNLDFLLGKGFSSTEFNTDTGEIILSSHTGLINLKGKQLSSPELMPTDSTIKFYREEGMGNYPGSYASAYGTARITKKDISEVQFNEAQLYNSCSTPIRLMLSQRWAWYHKHRNDDMICTTDDLDRITRSTDNINNILQSCKPQDSGTNKYNKIFNL